MLAGRKVIIAFLDHPADPLPEASGFGRQPEGLHQLTI
jgi:hypothetical protein